MNNFCSGPGGRGGALAGGLGGARFGLFGFNFIDVTPLVVLLPGFVAATPSTRLPFDKPSAMFARTAILAPMTAP